MSKNYKSFSSVAKSRFKGMANELGYEQVSGIVYQKENDGWFEGFSLQASQWGNDFFYINYGVCIPNLWEPFSAEINRENIGGYLLSHRLHNDHNQGFDNGTKEQVEKSASIALEKYKEQAVPWFRDIKGLNDIAERYFDSKNLDKNNIGKHEYFSKLGAANYGLLLFKAGQLNEAKIWLNEADRLYSLPLYSTPDGRWIHEKEKYARLMNPESYQVSQHNTIKKVIQKIECA
ncbi:MAG: DUF4304 domain-containing protein [Cellvibrionales bacterium]|nr:DUF4304 domain-containing protein [Cellvibrionales bacterium]